MATVSVDCGATMNQAARRLAAQAHGCACARSADGDWPIGHKKTPRETGEVGPAHRSKVRAARC